MENLKILLDDLKNKKNLRQTLSALRAGVKEDRGFKALFKEDDKAIEALLKSLTADDAKARKSAALLIGDLGLSAEEKYRKALLEAYRQEQTLFVRESYLKSIAECGGENALTDDEREELEARIEQIDSTDFPDADMKHILAERKALTQLVRSVKKKAAVFKEPSGVPVLMVPVKGFYEPLKKALNDRGITKGFSQIGALLWPGDIDRVRDLRIYDHLKYLISGDFTLEADKIREEIEKSALASFIRKAYNVQVSVRVHIHEKGDRSLKQAKRFTGELLRMSGGDLVNEAPYDAELHFYKKKSGGYVLFLKPVQEDQRFTYDINRLSTSMQPVKAALMVYLTGGYLRAHAKVIDLFAGNGSLLLERDEALRTKAMFACDTNEEAVEAGRKNAQAKGSTVNYVHRSAFTFDTEEEFDEIISELPDLFEKTAEDRGEFFEKLSAETVKVLRGGGRAFYLTAEGNEMKAMVRKDKRIEFVKEIPFDEKRSIFILEVKK
ncbi:MAG: class I SAM-dependent methyltransferase [Lachnospiraceae bacterium]|nr:class I SAM-dependent methyltransferase [Lachnospiraceae bacterium]